MADITSNLVAWYKLDETSGTSAADSSGNGNTGTYTNSPTLNQAGAWSGGKAVTLNGVNQHILSTDITQLNSVSAFTFSAWIYCNGNVTFSQIFGKIGASVNSRIFLSFYPDNTSLFLGVSNGGDTKGNTASVIPQNTWAHVTMVFDGTLTGDANRLKVYVNAVQKTITQFGAAVPATTANLAGYIADIGFDGGNPFKGSLDDVRIYSRALSASDVSALYAYSGNPDITSGLVAHYKLDESGGTTAVDSSGNGYTGTYVNGPLLNQAGAWSGGKAVTFASASTQYVDLGSKSAFTNISVSLWVKKASSGSHRVVSFGKTLIHLTDNSVWWYSDVGTGPVNYTVGVSIPVGTWTHIVISHSGTTASLYINGSLIETKTGIAAVSTTASGSCLAVYNGSSLPLDGSLDDVRIYSRALSPGDVAYLYSASSSTATSILQAPAKTITEVSPLITANATYPYIFRSRTL